MSDDLLASIHESEMKHAHALIAELELKNANALQLAVDEHTRAGTLEYRLTQVILAFEAILHHFVPQQGNLKVEQTVIEAAHAEIAKAKPLCIFDEPEEPEPEDDEPEDEICSGCSGCGEGQYEGTSCYKCHGSGIEPVEKDDDV